jgi:hypothetical protein
MRITNDIAAHTRPNQFVTPEIYKWDYNLFAFLSLLSIPKFKFSGFTLTQPEMV